MLVKAFLKYLGLMGLAAVLSGTMVFSALPMRALRVAFGRLPFWAGFLALAAGVSGVGYPLEGVTILALAVLVGIFSEVEEHGGSIFSSGAIAILASTGVVGIAVGFWLKQSKAGLMSALRAHLTPYVERLVNLNSNAQLEVDKLIHQLPAMLVITLMLSLAVALIWDNRMLFWFGLQQRIDATGEKILTFRAPDLAIWVTIVAILGANLKHGNAALEIASTNALYVLMAVFFFQGLAIVTYAFRVLKVGLVWQVFWYVFFVLQVFLVSLVGFADYWLDFRERLARKPAEENKSF